MVMEGDNDVKDIIIFLQDRRMNDRTYDMVHSCAQTAEGKTSMRQSKSCNDANVY